jgi:uncharacterized membrane protein (DUF106 family)
MNEKKEASLKTTWGCVAAGALFFIMGFIMIFQGIEASKTGAIIPLTPKSGPMTGLQSIITGSLASIAGTVFLGYEVFKKIKQKRRKAHHSIDQAD